jgi:hypothetical protein
MIARLFNNPGELEGYMERYIASCQGYNVVKLRDGEGGDYLETLRDLNNDKAKVWLKAPSIHGFCNYLGINRQTYYNYEKKPGFCDVIHRFEEILDEANVDSLYRKESSNGAQFYLKLRGYETPLDKANREIKEQALETAKVTDAEKLKAIELKNELLKLQIDKLKDTGELDPAISKLINAMGLGAGDDNTQGSAKE